MSVSDYGNDTALFNCELEGSSDTWRTAVTA